MRIDLGTLPGGNAVATVTFQARIRAPLAAGVTRVSNQATVIANNSAAIVSDDPTTAEMDDATVTQVVASPVLRATKQDTLAVDADNNGLPSPGTPCCTRS